MTLLLWVDLLGFGAAAVALANVFRGPGRGAAAEARGSAIALLGIILISYILYLFQSLGAPQIVELIGDYALVVAPIAFFFFFYVCARGEANLDLIESEARYRAIFEGSADGIVIAETDGRRIDANAAACSMFGYSRDELLNIPPNAIIHPDEVGDFQESWRQAVAGTPWDGKAKGVRKDGTVIDVEAGARLVTYKGKPRIMVLIRDITERIKAEATRNRLMSMIDATTDLIGTAEARTGRTLFMNRAGLEMLGYESEADIVGVPTAAFHTEDAYRRMILKGIPEALEKGSWRGETRLKGRDGTEIDVSQVIVAHRSTDGRIDYMSTIARDITDNKRAAEELRQSERRLFRFMENLPVGIVIMTTSGELYLINRAARELLDREVDPAVELGALSEVFQVYRTGTAELYPVDRIPAFRALSGERVHVDDMEIRRADRAIPIEVWASPVRNDQGKITHVVAAFMDISERRQAEVEQSLLEHQLLQAQKMESIGQLAGGVAHDFNNLLVAIIGYSEMLLHSAAPDAPYTREIGEIRKAGERAAALTRQLLAFSRKQVLQPQVLSLNRVVRETEKLLKRIIGEQIELVSELAEPIGPIEADPAQLEQVIVNLAINARDAMPQGGRLEFRTREIHMDSPKARDFGLEREGRYVEFSVTDSGVGMSEEVRLKIFEPFFTTKERGKGTGLGLSTVYGIVKQTGGGLAVDSSVGSGTRFIFVFPVTDRPLSDHDETENPAGTHPSRGTETILLVEDEDAPRRFSCRALCEQGYKVLEAETAEQALELGSAYPGKIDLLFTDVILPGMGGGELAERLLAERPGIRVVFTSGYTDSPTIREAVREGSLFLQKPYKLGALATIVRHALDQ